MKKTLFLLVFLSFWGFGQKKDSLWAITKFRNFLPTLPSPIFTKDTVNIGRSELGYKGEENSLRDAYMPEKSDGFFIKSERYVSLKNWRIFGSYEFIKSEEKNRNFTDFANPYRANPYKIADSSAADWRVQQYRLFTKISTPEIAKNIRAGLGIRYDILNGARQKDPRPLDKTISIELTPSIVLSHRDKLELGINGYYNRYMQDFSLSLENNLRTKNIYKMTGIGEYLFNGPVITTGLSRNYRGDTFGGGATIGLAIANDSKIIARYNFKNGKETALEGTSNPFRAGDHKFREHSGELIFQKNSTKAAQSFALSGMLKQTDDTEFIQTLDPSTQQYQTLYSSRMHWMDLYRAALRYGIIVKKQKGINYSVFAQAEYYGFHEAYPSTLSKQEINTVSGAVNFKKWIYTGENILTISVGSKYQRNINAEYIYFLKDYSKNFVSKSITYPNFLYNMLDMLENRVGIEYILKPFGKSKSNFFLAANYDNRLNLSNNALYEQTRVNNYFGFSIGLIN